MVSIPKILRQVDLDSQKHGGGGGGGGGGQVMVSSSLRLTESGGLDLSIETLRKENTL